MTSYLRRECPEHGEAWIPTDDYVACCDAACSFGEYVRTDAGGYVIPA